MRTFHALLLAIALASLTHSTQMSAQGAPVPADPIADLASRPASALDVMLIYAEQRLKAWHFDQVAPFEMRTIYPTAERVSASTLGLFVTATFYPSGKALPTAENCAQAAYWLRKQLFALGAGQLGSQPALMIVQDFFMPPVLADQDTGGKLAAALSERLYLDVGVLARHEPGANFWAEGTPERLVHCRLKVSTESLAVIPATPTPKAVK